MRTSKCFLLSENIQDMNQGEGQEKRDEKIQQFQQNRAQPKRSFAPGFSYYGERDIERRPHGSGELSFCGRLLYRGEFKHGEITGRGHRVYFDGSTFTGSFLCGQRHGYGIWSSANSHKIQEGTFRNDKLHGVFYRPPLFSLR